MFASLTPRLQPGAKREEKKTNRFNGLSFGPKKPLKRLSIDFIESAHRAKATVLVEAWVIENERKWRQAGCLSDGEIIFPLRVQRDLIQTK